MRRLLCSLVVGASLALGVPATAAQAATYRASDPRGDVDAVVFDPATYDVTTAPAPAGTEPDATRLVVQHTGRALKLRVTLVSLSRPVQRQAVGIAFGVRGSNGQKRLVQVYRQALPSKVPGTRVVRPSTGKPVCRGAARSTFDYRADVVTVTVPRHCLGAPARVKVSGYALVSRDTRSGGVDGTTYDDLLRAGGQGGPVSLGSVATPWIRRG